MLRNTNSFDPSSQLNSNITPLLIKIFCSAILFLHNVYDSNVNLVSSKTISINYKPPIYVNKYVLI
jgi:hypothetical protein